MYQILFRNWKFAALWAIGISISIAVFFGEGGGHEQLEQSAQQIREKRSGARNLDASEAQPVEQTIVAEPAPVAEEEADETEFGEPMIDTE